MHWALEQKLSFSLVSDSSFLLLCTFLWEDETIADTACVCGSEAGVHEPRKIINTWSRVQLYLEGDSVEIWAAGEQCAHIGWCSAVFLVAKAVSETREGSITKVLITWSTDDNPLDQEMEAAVYTGRETQAGPARALLFVWSFIWVNTKNTDRAR